MSPLSLIYGAATGIRNRLYDRGVVGANRLSQPVISVGNLSAGGAGKTPFVILLGELLKQREIPFDVLSRGYGRSTRGVLVVDPEGSAEEFGDEPILIARRLGCPVVVGEDRYQAGKLAEEKFGPRWHFLDDGFQHRSLARDFDIVLLTAADVNDRLLPRGRLREPLSSLARADAIVLSGEIENKNFGSTKTIWRLRRGIEIRNPPSRPVVFCGIARPTAFVEQLQAGGISPASTKFYRDHHRYSEPEIRELMAIRKRNDADGFITTEKDIVNLGPHLSRLADVAVARVTMELENADAAVDTLVRVIAERRGSA